MKAPEPDYDVEGFGAFINRCAAAGVRELWVSIGHDEQADLPLIFVSPRSETSEEVGEAAKKGIVTRKFAPIGDQVFPMDGVHNFSEAVMRSGMTLEQKCHWLYETCREAELTHQRALPPDDPSHRPSGDSI